MLLIYNSDLEKLCKLLRIWKRDDISDCCEVIVWCVNITLSGPWQHGFERTADHILKGYKFNLAYEFKNCFVIIAQLCLQLFACMLMTPSSSIMPGCTEDDINKHEPHQHLYYWKTGEHFRTAKLCTETWMQRSSCLVSFSHLLIFFHAEVYVKDIKNPNHQWCASQVPLIIAEIVTFSA